MESVWWAFSELYKKNLVYEGRRVILYCPRCSTPLSNFEIAMDNSYREVASDSLFVKFKAKGVDNEYFVAWTTTPWTLPGNVGLAVKPDADYSLVQSGNDQLWFASRLAPKNLPVHKTVKGKDLIGKTYLPLFNFLPVGEQKSYVVCGADFVSLDDGTGIVHTAAIYGEDDYQLAIKEGLPTIPMLDDQGKFLDFVTPLSGQFYNKVAPWVIDNLTSQNLVFKATKTTHSYPFCYRCSTPLYYNAVPAWFINIQKLKPELKKQNQYINWYPSFLKEGRFGKGLDTAPDWNISRSRYWGTPMPIWKGDKTCKIRVISSLSELKKWVVDPNALSSLTDIHREYIDSVKVYVDDAKTEVGTRIPDVFDCWIESGSMPFASLHYPFEQKETFESRYPAQYIVEYVAQTRAWFYTLHVLSVALFGKPAFENAVTTGTILAEDGTKMSKSKKNYPDPMLLINKYGVDSLRLYLMSSVVMKADNLNFQESAVDEIRKNVMNIWWNIFAFYKTYCGQESGANLPATIHNVLDRWLVSKINNLTAAVTKAMDSYDVVTATRESMAFAKEFSTWYVRLSRDRIKENKTTQQVFAYALKKYCLIMAPFAPFMSERIYQNMSGGKDSIHLEDWPLVNESLLNSELEQTMKKVMLVVEKAHSLRKAGGTKLRLRQPLAKLTIEGVFFPEEITQLIRDELNVKQVEVVAGGELNVYLDTNITFALEEEGIARDLMRDIQEARKKLGLSPQDRISVTLPSWPSSWEAEIVERVGADKLVCGAKLTITKL